MNEIKQNFEHSLDLSDEEFELLQLCLKIEEIKAKTIIIKAEQKVLKLYFVKSGLLRTYFACDGQFITSYSSFITQAPSPQYLKAVEESILYSIAFEQLNRLYDRHSCKSSAKSGLI